MNKVLQNKYHLEINVLKTTNLIKFFIFLSIWLIINTITAWKTELYADEAYYWMYSNFLDWGYFDHPPGVAIIIKLGTELLGKNEFGVRIFTLLLTTISFLFIYLFIKPKNVFLFSLTLFSFPILHIIGFLSLPDVPFFFTSLIFLYSYKLFLDKKSFMNQLFMGVSAALMLYCKYHGVLVISLAILSNYRLLKDYRLYITGLISLVLLSPHIYWQYIHDFPSISYHLFDRSSKTYSLANTLYFVLGNIPFLGGIVALFLFFTSFKYKINNVWEKALKWNLLGTFGFFLFITFKGQHIEANWTLPAVFPMIYLGYKQVEKEDKLNLLRILTLITLPLIILYHVHLIYPFAIIKGDRVNDLHGAKEFALTIEDIADSRKIACKRYQEASILNFYGSQNYYIPALNINSRANQYSIWQIDSSLFQTNIAYVGGWHGQLIQKRKFEQTNIELIDQVTSPNNLSYNVASINQQNGFIEIGLNIRSKTDSLDYEPTNQFKLEFYFYKDNILLLKERLEIKLNLISDEPSFYSFNIEQIEQANSFAVLLFQKKLRGSNNHKRIYKIDGKAK